LWGTLRYVVVFFVSIRSRVDGRKRRRLDRRMFCTAAELDSVVPQGGACGAEGGVADDDVRNVEAGGGEEKLRCEVE